MLQVEIPVEIDAPRSEPDAPREPAPELRAAELAGELHPRPLPRPGPEPSARSGPRPRFGAGR